MLGKLFVSGKIYVKNSQGELTDDDPIVSLLERPNDLQNFQEFGKEFIYYLFSAGWTYILPDNKSAGFEKQINKKGQIFNLNPDNIQFQNSRKINLFRDSNIGFNYQSNYSSLSNLSYSKDIVPFYYGVRDKDNPFIGVSNLDALNREIRNIVLADKAKENQIRLSGHTVVTPDAGRSPYDLGLDKPIYTEGQDGMNISVTEKQEIERKLLAKGLGNGNPITIASKGLRSFNLMAALSSFNFDDLKKEDIKSVLNSWHIPKEYQYIDRDATTFENMEKAQLFMYQNIIEPIADNFCKSLQQWYKYPNEIVIDYTHLPVYTIVEQQRQDTRIKEINEVIELRDKNIYTNEQAVELINQIDEKYKK